MAADSAAGEASSTANFLVWATGSRRNAWAIVLVPGLAALVPASVGYVLNFGTGVMFAQGAIPWDMLSEYRCFLFEWNTVLFSIWLAPPAAAVWLLTRPRFRLASDVGTPPKVAWPFWLAAIPAAIIALVLAPEISGFGTLPHRLCYFASFHVGAWIAMGIANAVLSPPVTVTVLAASYALWRRVMREPLAGLPAPEKTGASHLSAAPSPAATEATGDTASSAIDLDSAPPYLRALRRSGQLAMGLGGLLLLYGVWLMRHGDIGTPLTALPILAVGFMLLRGSLVGARIGAWLAAGWLASVFGAVLIAPLQTPLPLLKAELTLEPLRVAWNAVSTVLEAVIALWFYQKLRAPEIVAARLKRGWRTSVPWTGFAAGAALALSAGYFLYHMQAGYYGQIALKQARDKYGPGFEYQVRAMRAADGFIYANMIGYNATAVFDFDVFWDQKTGKPPF